MALVACPKCSVTLDVPENLLGQQVRCATCSTVFEARPQETLPAAAPQPPGESASGLEEDRHERRWGTDAADLDDDDFDDRRRRRRDLEPHRGGTVLTFGILSLALGLFLCALFGVGLGIPAITMGRTDLRKIREGTMDPDGAVQTQVGFILGWVGLGLGILQLLACGAYLLFVMVIMGSQQGGR
jgi:hypothetical protein